MEDSGAPISLTLPFGPYEPYSGPPPGRPLLTGTEQGMVLFLKIIIHTFFF